MKESLKVFLIIFSSLSLSTLFFVLFTKFYLTEFSFNGRIVDNHLIGEERIKYRFIFGKFKYVRRYFLRGDIEIINFSCSEGYPVKEGLEISCFGPFKSKEVELYIKYKIRNAFEVYRDYGILFHSLFDEFGSFVKVKYKIELPREVVRVYEHPPIIRSSISGRILEANALILPNERFELRILTKRNGLRITKGIFAEKIIKKVEPKSYEIGYYISFLLKTTIISIFPLLPPMIFLSPILYYFYWRRYGKEFEVVGIPMYHRIPPKKRKSWEVAILLNDGCLTSTAIQSTILELKKKGYLDFVKVEEGFIIKRKRYLIKILKTSGEDLDGFQKLVLSFIRKFSKNGIFDIERLKRLNAREVMREYTFLFKNPVVLRKEKEFFYIEGKKKTLNLAILNFIIFSISLISIFLTKLHIFLPTLFSSMITMVSLSYGARFSSKTKREFIKERRLWEAFRRFLSDTTMMKENPPESLDIWEEYLIYATALGIAKSVIKAMDDLNLLEDFERKHKISLPLFAAYLASFDSTMGFISKRAYRGPLGGIGGGVGGGGGGAG